MDKKAKKAEKLRLKAEAARNPVEGTPAAQETPVDPS